MSNYLYLNEGIKYRQYLLHFVYSHFRCYCTFSLLLLIIISYLTVTIFNLEIRIDRKKFESMTELVNRVILAAEMEKCGTDDIFLVGGCTYNPQSPRAAHWKRAHNTVQAGGNCCLWSSSSS